MNRHEWLQYPSREHHPAFRPALAAEPAVAAGDPAPIRAAVSLRTDALGSDRAAP